MDQQRASARQARSARREQNADRTVPSRASRLPCGDLTGCDGSGLNPGRSESDQHACPCLGRPGPLAEWAGRSHARPGAQVALGRTGIQAKTMDQQRASARQARSARRARNVDRTVPSRASRLPCGDLSGSTGQPLNPHRSESDQHACPCLGRPGPLAEWGGRSHARPGAQFDLGRPGIQAKTMDQQRASARQARSARRARNVDRTEPSRASRLPCGDLSGSTGQPLNPHRSESDQHACPCLGRPGRLAEWAGRSHARPEAQFDLGRTGIQAKTMDQQRASARQARSARRARNADRTEPSRASRLPCGDLSGSTGQPLTPHRSESDRHGCPCLGRPGPLAEWVGPSHARPEAQVDLGRTGIQAKTMDQQRASARQARSARRERNADRTEPSRASRLPCGDLSGSTGLA